MNKEDRNNSTENNKMFMRSEKDRDLPEIIEEEIFSDFLNIHQGNATNTLSRIKGRITDPAQLDLYGNGIITDKDFEVFISKYTELASGIKPTAQRLLDALILTATASGKRESMVRLPLREYMDYRGLKDIKEARKQVKTDLDALSRLRVTWREKRKGKTQGDFLNLYLSGGKNGIGNGIIYFLFNQDFFNVIMNYPIMPFPTEILRINPHRNPNSTHFLRRVALHKKMNRGKSNENIISVKTLLEATPELPKYENIAGRGQIDQRIIEPFTRDMDAIKIFKWNYCGKNGSIVDAPANYNDFESCLINITWVNYPDKTLKKEGGYQ